MNSEFDLRFDSGIPEEDQILTEVFLKNDLYNQIPRQKISRKSMVIGFGL